MVGLLAMTGGIFVAGLGIYKSVTGYMRGSGQTVTEKKSQHIERTRQHVAQAQPYDEAELTDKALHRGLVTSSLSLGLASAGLLFFAPLQYVSVPVLVYMGIPSAQDAYDILYIERRPSRALSETAVLVISLASGYYWVTSLGFFLYYAGRMLHHNRLRIDKPLSQDMWQVPSMTRLLKDTEEIIVQTATLQAGDQVIVETSEVVPGDGVIVEGSALLRSLTMPNGSGMLKQPGDSVGATDIILVGHICIQIQKAG